MKTKTQTQGENLKIILPVRYITLIIKIRKRNNKIYSFFLGTTSPNPFDMSGLSPNLMSTTSASNTGTKPKKSVHSLLGEHSNLVNLDNLVTADNKKNSTQGMQFHLLLISLSRQSREGGRGGPSPPIFMPRLEILGQI